MERQSRDNTIAKSESNLTQSQVLDAIPIGIIVYSATFQPLSMNPVAANLLPNHSPLDTSLISQTITDTGPSEGWTAWLKHPFVSDIANQIEGVAIHQTDKIQWIRLTTQPIPSEQTEDGKSIALLTIEDLGQQVRSRQTLDHTDQLANLGKKVSLVAHELNGPLDGVLRYLNLTTRAIEKQRYDKSQEYIERCREGLERMVQIVSDILSHVRVPLNQVNQQPLESIIKESIHSASTNGDNKNTRLHLTIDPNTPPLCCSQLHQVLCNVIRNAFESMPNGGNLDIQARLKPDNHLVIKLTDSGPGISKQNLERVFDPFYSTKTNGTGLGLAISFDIIQSLGGAIDVASSPQGTEVTITLPLVNIT